jgi:hypothetical protein
MGNTSSKEVTFDQIDELARWLCKLKDSGAIWCAFDEAERLYWRREAQKRLYESRTDLIAP